MPSFYQNTFSFFFFFTSSPFLLAEENKGSRVRVQIQKSFAADTISGVLAFTRRRAYLVVEPKSVFVGVKPSFLLAKINIALWIAILCELVSFVQVELFGNSQDSGYQKKKKKPILFFSPHTPQ